MFAFLKFKIYRKTFIQYTLFIVISIIISFGVSYWALLATVASRQSENANIYFSKIEEQITDTQKQINQYMSRMYASPSLFNDFMHFFSSDAETYNKLRIDNNAPRDLTANFIKDLNLFIKSTNNNIKKICFFSHDNVNVINFSNNGAEYIFDADSADYTVNRRDLSYGHVSSQDVTSPSDFNQVIGTIAFVINTPAIFDATDSSNLFNAAIVCEKTTYTICGKKLSNPKMVAHFFTLSDTLHFSLFENVHYNVFTSANYSYKLVTAASTSDLIGKYDLIIFLLIFILHLFILALIIHKLNRDAKAFSEILFSISCAEKGQFTLINTGRKDEYGQIANALNQMGHKISDFIDKEYILHLEQQKAEMKALQNQISPHFLFNTLEIIRYRASSEQNSSIASAIENLGGLFRDIVKSDEHITIADEILILQKYLDLMKFRYPGRFTYLIEMDDCIKHIPTVKCWMQPIVENFFKYGFDKNSEYNLLIIEGNLINNLIQLDFINNGAPIDEATLVNLNDWFASQDDPNDREILTNIGLKNVYSRLKILYGKTLTFKISNQENEGVSITITFEIEENEDV